MKSRYPLSSLAFMVLTLGVILVVLTKAKAIIPIGGAVVVVFAGTCAVAAVAWAVLFALRRAGVHRLAQAQTWPPR